MADQRPRDEINWWPLYIGITIVVLGLGALLIAKGMLISAIFLVVPLGWVAARFIVNGGEWLANKKYEADWKDWQGINYGYGPYHLRALEHDDQLWFYEADLLAVCGGADDSLTRLLPASQRLPLEGTKFFVLNQAGCEHLLMKLQHPEAKKLFVHLQREAYFAFERRKGRPMQPVVR